MTFDQVLLNGAYSCPGGLMSRLRSRLRKLEEIYLDDSRLVVGSDAWFSHWLRKFNRYIRGEEAAFILPRGFLRALLTRADDEDCGDIGAN